MCSRTPFSPKSPCTRWSRHALVFHPQPLRITEKGLALGRTYAMIPRFRTKTINQSSVDMREKLPGNLEDREGRSPEHSNRSRSLPLSERGESGFSFRSTPLVHSTRRLSLQGASSAAATSFQHQTRAVNSIVCESRSLERGASPSTRMARPCLVRNAGYCTRIDRT